MKKLKLILPLTLMAAIPVAVISCSCSVANTYAPTKLPANWETQSKYQLEKFEDVQYNDQNMFETKSSGFGKNIVLNVPGYNYLYDKMGEFDVAFALIANHKLYAQILPMKKDDMVWDILHRSAFEFNTHDTPGLGLFINSFRLKGETQWRAGTREETNYGDKYPLYYINHNFSQFGVSNWKVSPREIYEFTYDDK